MKAQGAKGLRVPFGIRQGRLYPPDMVENGLNCGCHCPKCNARLVANHPSSKRSYFSHHKAEDCKKGFETALHLMAKQIIEDNAQVTLPSITLEITAETLSDFKLQRNVSFPSKTSSLFEVSQEKSAGKWRPDLTAQLKNGATLYVEILVTHPVEEEKAEALDNLMEIDLSNVDADDLDDLREIVIAKAPRKWHRCSLYNNLPKVTKNKAKMEEELVKGVLGQRIEKFSVKVSEVMHEDMNYRGFNALVRYDTAKDIFIAYLIDTTDKISVHGESIAELTTNFHAAVEQYLKDRRFTG